ncbi:Uncharacterized protein BP5553_10049 [Venustampulla echinocandica]|uniref:Uncharacterized protein n=1 Tax=Venustampulla echinocandica TaxID=2656787 RepID=A0A370TA76_9HELO|nr:Uncharacterized protein BP5553_10049 [Venustampulla echinocandica]RDL30704.1 Uncharacterized protein BP5553_10049 [Venustampulla echinocandica]
MAKTIANFSILEAMNALCISIPQWNERLDQLNGQIALRQIELARLEETDRPRTQPSLRNKGSTESLRPRDADENPFHAAEDEDREAIQLNPFERTESDKKGISPNRPPNSSKAAEAAAARTPPQSRTAADPNPFPGTLKRQMSHPSHSSQARIGPNVLRKRKTESLASGESLAPKYRTRSMIIVYYDSAVQTAFEDLVKFVSGSRNSMRRGKMAAKMAEMKKAAEEEFAEEEDEEDSDEEDSNDLTLNNGNIKVGQNGGGAANISVPKLKYTSTRQMGPPKAFGKPEYVGSTLSVGLLRGHRKGGDEDIFDELDKGLEWCQSQCEQGAHHFLREGQCTSEIANIKKKLLEVKQVAEREIEKQEKEEASNPSPPVKSPPRQLQGMPRTRELRKTQMRKEPEAPKDLEVDEMEVDDEGVDDLELPTKIVFKRAGDFAL